MKPSGSSKSVPVNVKRRRVIQGVGAVAAATVAGPVFSGALAPSESVHLSGKVISQVGGSIKTLILRNNSTEAVTIEKFANGGLAFDGEVFDCNGACMNSPLTISSGKEALIQFDDRNLMGTDAGSQNLMNVQADVHRLSAGTRVIDINGLSNGRVVTLVPTASAIYS